MILPEKWDIRIRAIFTGSSSSAMEYLRRHCVQLKSTDTDKVPLEMDGPTFCG